MMVDFESEKIDDLLQEWGRVDLRGLAGADRPFDVLDTSDPWKPGTRILVTDRPGRISALPGFELKSIARCGVPIDGEVYGVRKVWKQPES